MTIISPLTCLGRVRANLAYYYMQYLILTAIVFGITLLFSPSALLEVGIMAAVWVVVVLMVKDRGDTFKTITLGITGLVSAIVIFWLLESVFWWAFGVSAILILAHATYQDPTKHSPPSSAEGATDTNNESGTQQQPQPESEMV